MSISRLNLLLSVFVCFFSAITFASDFDGYIVKVKSTRNIGVAASALEAEGIPVTDTIPQLGLVLTRDNPLNASAGARALVQYVSPNYTVRMAVEQPSSDAERMTAEDLRRDVEWGMEAIHAPEAWKVSMGNPNVIVAVSDTGIYNHYQLKPNFWANPGETGTDANGKNKAKNKIDDDHDGYVDDVTGWNFVSNTPNTWDMHYHGTHVSGIIAARDLSNGRVLGVAPRSTLISVPFINGQYGGSDAQGIKTIVFAADHGAKVVNCSWGGDGFDQGLYDAIEYAKNKGVLVVAAAGNDGANTDKNKFYPANYGNENLIAVAATSSKNGELAGFSNYGAHSVDLAAPGNNILSTFNPNESTLRPYLYFELSGTSMAAPHVTGAVALVYAVNPKLTWRQVKQVILSTVQVSPKLQGKVITGGQLDVAAAVKKALAM